MAEGKGTEQFLFGRPLRTMACVEGGNERTEELHVTCIFLVLFYMMGINLSSLGQ